MATPIFLFIYCVFIIAFFMQVVRGAANGSIQFPKVRLEGNFTEIIKESLGRIFAPFIGVFWPIMVVSFIFLLSFQPSSSVTDQIIMWVFFIIAFSYCTFALFLLPMSILLWSLFGDSGRIANPLNLIHQIKLIRTDYLKFLCGVVSFLGCYVFARHFILKYLFSKTASFYITYFLVDGAIHIYSAIIIGLLLGNMSYRRRYELKWLPYTKKKPEIIIEKTPYAEDEPVDEHDLESELAEKMSQAAYLLNHGNYRDAALIFEEVLYEHPDNFEALQGGVRAAFGLGDGGTVNVYGKQIAALFVEQRAYEALWNMYEDYRQKIEDFTFDPPEMTELARWLDNREMHLEAARVLRELAVRYPDDERTPEALYRCARLLWEKCDKPDTAEKIIDTIFERYPESKYAGDARNFLDNYKPGK